MPDFDELLKGLNGEIARQVKAVRGILPGLIHDGCASVGAAEGSIITPNREQTKLYFFASSNSVLDESDMTFGFDESVSGYVYSSGQAFAKQNPESKAMTRVAQIADVVTEYLMAIPICDEDQIYGVATFVNRDEAHEGMMFTPEELQAATEICDIYCVALKFVRQCLLLGEIAQADLRQLDPAHGEDEADNTDLDLGRSGLRIARILERLPSRDRTLFERMSELLLDHSEQGGGDDELV